MLLGMNVSMAWEWMLCKYMPSNAYSFHTDSGRQKVVHFQPVLLQGLLNSLGPLELGARCLGTLHCLKPQKQYILDFGDCNMMFRCLFQQLLAQGFKRIGLGL